MERTAQEQNRLVEECEFRIARKEAIDAAREHLIERAVRDPSAFCREYIFYLSGSPPLSAESCALEDVARVVGALGAGITKNRAQYPLSQEMIRTLLEKAVNPQTKTLPERKVLEILAQKVVRQYEQHRVP
jgi:hypothetical protein